MGSVNRMGRDPAHYWRMIKWSSHDEIQRARPIPATKDLMREKTCGNRYALSQNAIDSAWEARHHGHIHVCLLWLALKMKCL